MTVDPKQRPQAERDAIGMLGRRPLTASELRSRLTDRGHDERAVEQACARVHEAGFLDDRRLAYEFIVLRGPRLGHGRQRLLRELARRGVASELAEAAWRQAVEQGDLDPELLLRRKLERQLRGARRLTTERDYVRVYNALRRAGFDEGPIRRELAPYRAFDSRDDPTTDEAFHDLP